MLRSLTHIFKGRDMPRGVRVLTAATAVRWFGWGFAESLIPIFIFSFSSGFAEAGLLRVTYDACLVLALPFIGLAADKVRATSLVLAGMALNFAIGASYWYAGVTGAVAYVIAARALNGVSYALDSVGRSTYFRRHEKAGRMATIFGYFDTIANFWWMVAALIGMVLLKFFSIPDLLFLITPLSVVSFLMVWKFQKGDRELVHPVDPVKAMNTLNPASSADLIDPGRNGSGPVGVSEAVLATNEAAVEVDAAIGSRMRRSVMKAGNWNLALKCLVGLNFFIAAAGAVVAFFLPIEAYSEGASLSLIILFGVVSTIPMLFGLEFGEWFDVKGINLFLYALVLFGALIFSIPFFSGYAWKLIVAFLAGVVLEFLSVGSSELITVHANPEHFGQVEGVMRSISNIGAIAGPLAVGISIDNYGLKASYVTLAAVLFAMAALFNLMKRSGMLDGKR